MEKFLLLETCNVENVPCMCGSCVPSACSAPRCLGWRGWAGLRRKIANDEQSASTWDRWVDTLGLVTFTCTECSMADWLEAMAKLHTTSYGAGRNIVTACVNIVTACVHRLFIVVILGTEAGFSCVLMTPMLQPLLGLEAGCILDSQPLPSPKSVATCYQMPSSSGMHRHKANVWEEDHRWTQGSSASSSIYIIIKYYKGVHFCWAQRIEHKVRDFLV